MVVVEPNTEPSEEQSISIALDKREAECNDESQQKSRDENAESVPEADIEVVTDESAHKEEDNDREQFESQWYFLLVCVGFAVGLGNVLRFPYLMYRNGGGAFFIPYLGMIVVMGFPLVVYELLLGQTFKVGPVQMFQQIIPSSNSRFGGVGLASIMALSMVSMYYAVLLGWSSVFFFHCFHFDVLPWKGDEDYFFREILHQTESINNLGGFNWYILLSVTACMLFVLLAVIKGVQGSSKVAVVTVTLPYVMLIVLLIRGVTLPGAATGISYYLTPDWSKLFHTSIWIDAAVQIMFSLSPAWGVLITFGSYLKPRESVLKLSVIVTFVNTSTSILAGFVVFSILGYLSYSKGVPIDDVVASGPTLAYVVFPAAIAEMPLAWLFALSFFTMMILLGIDSLFASVEAIIGAVQDSTWIREKNIPKYQVVIAVVVFVWIGSLVFCTNGGSYLLYAADIYVPLLSFFMVALLQIVAGCWAYGVDKIFTEFSCLVPDGRLRIFPVPTLWKILWSISCPLIIAVLIAIAFYNEFQRPTLDLPTWAFLLGWVFALAPGVTILWFAVFPSGIPNCTSLTKPQEETETTEKPGNGTDPVEIEMTELTDESTKQSIPHTSDSSEEEVIV